MRVVGIATGSAMVDGRPGDPPHRIAAMVYAFRPGVVPIVSSHRHGMLLGYLDAIAPSDGRDLILAGEVVDDADVIARFRAGVPISIEACEVGPAAPETHAAGQAWVASKPHWRGQLREGWNLVGVSVTSDPAASGSALWAVA